MALSVEPSTLIDKPNKPQLDKFKDAARELQTDDREEAFDARLKKVAKAKKTDVHNANDTKP